VYSKDSTVPAQEPFEPEGGSSNPHTAEKGCLALFHIWDGDQCFNEEFRSKFGECIASAGVANMADEILEITPMVEHVLIRQPVPSHFNAQEMQAIDAFFTQIDMLVTKDGQLSRSELALVIGEEASNQFMTDYDTDGDKQISRSEFVSGVLAELANLPSDEARASWLVEMNNALDRAQEDSTM